MFFSSNDCLDENYEINRILLWIKESKVQTLALQFPDILLRDAPYVAHRITNTSNIQVYILGDNVFGSCCVDSHTAAYIGAEAVIHFGSACLSEHDKLPVLYIFEKSNFEAKPFLFGFSLAFENENNFLIASDLKYHQPTKHVVAQLVEQKKVVLHLEPCLPICSQLSNCIVISGRSCQLPSHTSLENCVGLYIGDEELTMANFVFSLTKCCKTFIYNPSNHTFNKQNDRANQLLRKRNYLVEKAKDAKSIGILVATLGVADHLQIIERLKMLAKFAGKKCYTFVIGKLNPSKLANFPEIDCFVIVACPENSVMDTKDFYRPIITPFDFELAVNSTRPWTGDFVTNYRELLPGAAKFYPLTEGISVNDSVHISLLSDGSSRLSLVQEKHKLNSLGNDLNKQRINSSVLSTEDDVHRRVWYGLEPHVGETPIMKACPGRTGLASVYTCESETFNINDKTSGEPESQE